MVSKVVDPSLPVPWAHVPVGSSARSSDQSIMVSSTLPPSPTISKSEWTVLVAPPGVSTSNFHERPLVFTGCLRNSSMASSGIWRGEEK